MCGPGTGGVGLGTGVGGTGSVGTGPGVGSIGVGGVGSVGTGVGGSGSIGGMVMARPYPPGGSGNRWPSLATVEGC
jgi:hypothetical protein